MHTAHRAFVERYFLCKDGATFRPALPVENDEYHGGWLSSFQDSVVRSMPYLPPLTERQCADAYRGPKFRVYDEACRSLELIPFSDKDALLKSFVKFEKQKLSGAPRVINPRSSRYNLKLGKYLKHAEKHYFKAINRVFGDRTDATVIKGYNADRSASILRQKWDQFGHPVAIGLDATKFDMHVSVAALRYEHAFYKRLYPRNSEVRHLLDLQLINRGRARFSDGELEFEMRGTRSSGDINTSLGNCLLMCALVYAYTKEVGVDCELANNGDDCVVILESKLIDRFSAGLDAWFRMKGFAMTVEEPVFEFEQLEFCQTHPVWLSSGWRMVRNQRAVFQKDPMCLVSMPNALLFRRWLAAVGDCGMHATAGVPVQEAFYRCLHRNARGAIPGKKFYRHVFANTSRLEFSHGVVKAVISPEARVSYWAAFGVLPEEQILVERLLDKYVIEDWKSQPVTFDELVVAASAGLNIFTAINDD